MIQWTVGAIAFNLLGTAGLMVTLIKTIPHQPRHRGLRPPPRPPMATLPPFSGVRMHRQAASSPVAGTRAPIVPTIRRGLVLLLAYLASVFVASLVVVLFSGVQQSAVVWTDQLELILPLVFVLGVPVAWIPLAVALALMLRLLRSRLVATLAAFLVAAFAILVWDGGLVDRILSVEVSPMDPPLWIRILQALPCVVLVGLLGGLVFWAIAYRGRHAASPRSPA